MRAFIWQRTQVGVARALKHVRLRCFVVGKTDQYAKRDRKLDLSSDLAPLHAVLYNQTEHPKDVFYVFVCRVLLGQSFETRTGDMSCFATKNRRELKPIPNTSPPEPYHSLVARVCNHGLASGGCTHSCRLKPDRYSEFVNFHDCRMYPEYLVAYHRVSIQ